MGHEITQTLDILDFKSDSQVFNFNQQQAPHKTKPNKTFLVKQFLDKSKEKSLNILQQIWFTGHKTVLNKTGVNHVTFTICLLEVHLHRMGKVFSTHNCHRKQSKLHIDFTFSKRCQREVLQNRLWKN